MITAPEIAKMKFEHLELRSPWNKIVGKPSSDSSMLLFSRPGSGKSTIALQLADELTAHGTVGYVPAEEGISSTLQNKLERTGLTQTAIKFIVGNTLEEIKQRVLEDNIEILFIDSFTVLDRRLKDFEEFRLWAKANDILFISIVQTTKEGKFYGNADAAFNVDCVMQVIDGRPSTEATGKNRLGELYEHDVDLRSNPVKPIKNTMSKKAPRKNPVKVPFTITLNEIDKLHKVHSIKRLNSFVGSKHPCYVANHSGEKDNAKITFRYSPDYRNKVFTLDMLLDGKIEFTSCAKVQTNGFSTAWKQLLKKYGDLTVRIEAQDHAKKVLGAKEYRRQEKEFKGETPKKSSKPKKKALVKPSSFNVMVYVKPKGKGRYEAMDIQSGTVAGNLLYASLIPSVKLDELKEAYRKIAKDSDHVFQIRVAGKKGTVLWDSEKMDSVKKPKSTPKTTKPKKKPSTKNVKSKKTTVPKKKTSGKVNLSAARKQQAELKALFTQVLAS